MKELFRKEAIDHQGQKLDGEVTIATHMSFNWILAIIVSLVVIGSSYLMLGQYHKKEVVSGYLKPRTGLSKVYPVNTGVIEDVYVTEGEFVKEGQLLARVKTERVIASGGELNSKVIAQLVQQKELLQQSMVNEKTSLSSKVDRVTSKINNLDTQLSIAQRQKSLLDERISLNKVKHQDTVELNKKNFASQRELQAVEDSLLLLEQQYEDIKNKIASLEQQQKNLSYDLAQLPLTNEETIAGIKAKLSNIDQQISQTQAQSGFDIISYRDGYVSNILVQRGMAAKTNVPIMTILPEDTVLQAELFVPTRAYGFVLKGQKTRIRYQAFPYQRFGIYQGTVSQISKSILLPQEANVPVSLSEPMYRVIVELDSQHASAYGDEIPLQAGMLLEADVMVDSRSLFEWLFEPLYSIKGMI
ncbi:toxin secretion, membrane fusion protein [Pseudoalteromonas phenolica]|uniref:HlyD family secretion protein n=1 Tax=Pseudoalteromonas phenolica TaxID=161398 RepID=UPI00110A82E5|nr:HlyD family efflux transporter periplasmic adaptor subunit [Pseudoalteromonas phenolica]TMN87287.1 toxin secretion, membrane fusion protein [Pseudoalteromonas phenolica]